MGRPHELGWLETVWESYERGIGANFSDMEPGRIIFEDEMDRGEQVAVSGATTGGGSLKSSSNKNSTAAAAAGE